MTKHDETMGDYLGDDYLGDDYLGEDVGDDYLGAEDVIGQRFIAARRRAARGAQRARYVPHVMTRRRLYPRPLGTPLLAPPAWREAQAAPGVMTPQEGMLVLGLRPESGNATITVTGTYPWVGIPQRPFRGERLVVDVARTPGAGGASVDIVSLRVGQDEQLVSGQPVAAAAFSSTAYDTRLSLAAAQPGIIVTVVFAVGGVLPPGESVTLSVACIGRAVTS